MGTRGSETPKHCLQVLYSVYHGALTFITNSKLLTHHCLLYSRVGWPALNPVDLSIGTLLYIKSFYTYIIFKNSN